MDGTSVVKTQNICKAINMKSRDTIISNQI